MHQSPHSAKRAARRQFEAWADRYDRVPLLHRFLFQPSHRAFIEELVGWPGRARRFDLLDVGCGTGTLAMMVAGSSLAARVVGLDYVQAMCRVAGQKVRQNGLDGDVRFVAGDSEHLPFEAASFDVITCSHSFHHYPDRLGVLREMRRVLRPGGRLMLIDGFRDNVVGWLVFDVCVPLLESGVHHCPWWEVRALLERAGFVGIRQRKFNWFLPALLTVAEAPQPAGRTDRHVAS